MHDDIWVHIIEEIREGFEHFHAYEVEHYVEPHPAVVAIFVLFGISFIGIIALDKFLRR